MLGFLALLALVGQDESDATAPGSQWPEQRFGEFLSQRELEFQPTDAVVSPSGSIFLVGPGTGFVHELGPDGNERRLGPEDDPLRDATGITLGTSGELWVADTGNDRVRRMNAQGEVLAQWGPFGDEFGIVLRRPTDLALHDGRVFVAIPGLHRAAEFGPRGSLVRTLHEGDRFARPTGLAFDEQGTLWIVDGGRDRLERFDQEGSLSGRHGMRGPNPGLLADPERAAWHAGRLYVADATNHRICVFGGDGEWIYDWGIHPLRPRAGRGRLHQPSSVALHPKGEFAVVCEPTQNRYQMFGPTEQDPALFRTDPSVLGQSLSSHYGPEVSVSGELMVLFESETQSILVFDLRDETPVLLDKFGGHGFEPGFFADVSGLSLEGASLTVADRDAGRLTTYQLDHEPGGELRYRPDLHNLVWTVDLVAGSGVFEPIAIAADRDGGGFFVEARGSRIVHYGEDRKPRVVFGGRGGTPGRFRSPSGLALAPDGSAVYVADPLSGTLQGFDRDGEVLFAVDGLARPHGVAVDGEGNLYVTEVDAHRVRKLGADGRVLGSFGSAGLGPGELYRPRGIAVDDRGRVIVVDHGNHRLMFFSAAGEFLSAFGPRLYVAPTRR